MNLQTLINDCQKFGVSLQFNEGLLKLNGEPEKVKTAALRSYQVIPIHHPTQTNASQRILVG